MYDFLYYLIEHNDTKTTNTSYSSCDISGRYDQPKIYEKLIKVSLDKFELEKYIEENSYNDDDYIIREFRITDYYDIFDNVYAYLIFNTKIDKNLSSTMEIYIADILYDYTDAENLLKIRHGVSMIECQISKVDCILGIYSTSVFEFNMVNREYHVKCYRYLELDDRPIMKFIYLNNQRIKFLDESLDEYNDRIELNEKYEREEQQKVLEKEKLQKEKENTLKRKNEELEEQQIRVNKFLKLSKKDQEELLKFYDVL